VSRRKAKSGKLSVFKGREARLNKAIFHILALKSPQTIYEISKEVKAQRGLKHTKYTNINRRVKVLEEYGYIKKVGTRKTQAGFQASLYQLTVRAYLAILFNRVNLDNLIQKANEESILAILAAIIPEMSVFEVSSS